MSPSPSSSAILPLPMPGTPAWRARIASIFSSADTHVLLAFWLFGECLAVSAASAASATCLCELCD